MIYKRISAMIVMISMVFLSASTAWAFPQDPLSKGSDYKSALEKMLIIDTKLKTLGEELERAVIDLENRRNKLTNTTTKLNEAERELEGLRSIYNNRIASIYRHRGTEPIGLFLNASGLGELLAAAKLLVIIGENDARLVKRVERLTSEIRSRQASLRGAVVKQKEVVDSLGCIRQDLMEALVEQKKILERIQQSDTCAIVGETDAARAFAFPVMTPYTYIDSWGAPRMAGTAYSHSHKGTDIMALPWTGVLAVEDGTILKMGTNTLGGISLWLQGGSGRRYYYAHLYGYARGLEVGQAVNAGEVIGYVGDTGNAKGTPHLHFEMHTDDTGAANPYVFLLTIDPLKRSLQAKN